MHGCVDAAKTASLRTSARPHVRTSAHPHIRTSERRQRVLDAVTGKDFSFFDTNQSVRCSQPGPRWDG